MTEQEMTARGMTEQEKEDQRLVDMINQVSESLIEEQGIITEELENKEDSKFVKEKIEDTISKLEHQREIYTLESDSAKDEDILTFRGKSEEKNKDKATSYSSTSYSSSLNKAKEEEKKSSGYGYGYSSYRSSSTSTKPKKSPKQIREEALTKYSEEEFKRLAQEADGVGVEKRSCSIFELQDAKTKRDQLERKKMLEQPDIILPIRKNTKKRVKEKVCTKARKTLFRAVSVLETIFAEKAITISESASKKDNQ